MLLQGSPLLLVAMCIAHSAAVTASRAADADPRTYNNKDLRGFSSQPASTDLHPWTLQVDLMSQPSRACCILTRVAGLQEEVLEVRMSASPP